MYDTKKSSVLTKSLKKVSCKIKVPVKVHEMKGVMNFKIKLTHLMMQTILINKKIKRTPGFTHLQHTF